MRNGIRCVGGIALCVVFGGVALAYSIPAEQLNAQKIYWGLASDFEKPGEVRYQEVIKATPEYKELKKKKVKRGTGKYWILLSQASDRAVRSIAKVGEDTEYDLIASHGYLGSLDPAIPADDITDHVVKAMKDDIKKGK